jgi:plasmid stabilization system protein ParE
MLTKPYSLLITKNAEKDRQRIETYLEELDTKQQRLLAIAQAVANLPTQWKINPYVDKKEALKVCYVANWYSIFFVVHEENEEISVVAILAQSEDLSRLSD